MNNNNLSYHQVEDKGLDVLAFFWQELGQYFEDLWDHLGFQQHLDMRIVVAAVVAERQNLWDCWSCTSQRLVGRYNRAATYEHPHGFEANDYARIGNNIVDGEHDKPDGNCQPDYTSQLGCH